MPCSAREQQVGYIGRRARFAPAARQQAATPRSSAVAMALRATWLPQPAGHAEMFGKDADAAPPAGGQAVLFATTLPTGEQGRWSMIAAMPPGMHEERLLCSHGG